LALTKLTTPFIWTHFGDGDEKAKIKTILDAFPKNGRAVFLGMVQNTTVIQFYEKNPVDIFVNVSYSEGLPVSIMEALSFGIPCIATDVGGTSEIIDETCGLLVPRTILPVQLAEDVLNVSLDSVKWLKKRQGAWLMAKNRCNAQTNYQDFVKMLTKIYNVTT
jgi:glycosyltransferase involved in cell wall biosynthesis